jgi:uncharacterized protein
VATPVYSLVFHVSPRFSTESALTSYKATVGFDIGGPGLAFDCAKATGEVEKLICTDEGLAALDRKLDGVYKAALAKARDDVPKFLRTER